MKPACDALISTKGVVDTNIVAAQLASEDVTLESLMVRLLPDAAALARVPISSFRVGAVAAGIAASGQTPTLYLGANLEFDSLDLQACVHAEQAAVNNAWLHGETGISAIAVSAAPCGHCRQFLNELTTAADLQIVIAADDSTTNGSSTKHSLAELLPHPFGPQQLGSADRLMSGAIHPLTAPSSDPLVQHALNAASKSYAPYTGHLAGVALELADGHILCGRTAENAAFNPSLGPMHSALSQWAIRIGQVACDITAAAFVELPTETSRHPTAEAMLHSMAPGVRLPHHFAASG